jgi:hypothetical protein
MLKNSNGWCWVEVLIELEDFNLDWMSQLYLVVNSITHNYNKGWARWGNDYG